MFETYNRNDVTTIVASRALAGSVNYDHKASGKLKP